MLKVNKIEITKGRDGLFYVIAHTDSGKFHDSFFSNEAATEFAKAFYGRVK